jgi:polysaccharide export outer membrane protein
MRFLSKSLILTAGALLCMTGGLLGQAKLRTGDKVLVSISGVPATEQGQVNKEYAISEDGTINLPYLKTPIQAAGRSPSDLEDAIESAYRGNEIYTNPTITCGTQQGARFVDVSGQVKGPTRVPYTEDLTLMAAISACGGLTPYAKEREIQLIRNGKSSKHDMAKIRDGKQTDIKLEPGDKVIVDQTWF